MAFAMQISWMVIDTATGLGVTGLTAAGSFTTLKVLEDATLGADIKASATVVDDGAGQYHMAFTTATVPVKEVKVIPVMATATYQAVPVVVGAADLAMLAGTLSGALPELAADPGATPTLAQAVMLAYMKARNAETVTATAKTVKNSAGTTILTHTLSDDGTTNTKAKLA